MAKKNLLDEAFAGTGLVEIGKAIAGEAKKVTNFVGDVDDKAKEEIEREKARKAERANKAKAVQEKLEQRRKNIEKEVITYIEDTSVLGRDTLEINHVLFAMPTELTPPTAIRVDKQNINFKWQTLRTTASQKVTSGHANARITMALYFVGQNAINTGLRDLIATFKALPFVFIENRFLRSNLSPNSTATMACSLVNMTVRTEQDLPDTLVVNLDLQWFNYRPYSAGFFFRKDRNSTLTSDMTTQDSLVTLPAAASKSVHDETITSAEGTDVRRVDSTETLPLKRDPLVQYSSAAWRPINSTPLVQFVNSKKGPTLGKLSNTIRFGFREYAQVRGPATPEIVKKFADTRRGALAPVTGPHIERGSEANNLNLELRPAAAQALEQAAKTFYENPKWRGTKLPINSCFRSYTEQAEIKRQEKDLANPAGTSWHEAGLAVDIDVKRPGSARPGINKKQWEYFKEVAGSLGWKPAAQWPQEECWHFTYKPGVRKFKGNVGRAIEDVRLREGLTPEELEIVKKALAEQREERERIIQQKWDEGYSLDATASNTSILVFYKEKEFEITTNDALLVPQGIAIARHNMIANLPIAGHEFATQQYLGSTDMDAVIYFTAVGDTKLKELQSMIEIVQQNSRSGRTKRTASVIGIQNSLFDFMEFNKGLVDGISAESIPGSPDLYSVTLQLTQYVPPDSKLEQERFISAGGWRDAAQWVYKHLRRRTDRETAHFAPNALSDFSAAKIHMDSISGNYDVSSLLEETGMPTVTPNIVNYQRFLAKLGPKRSSYGIARAEAYFLTTPEISSGLLEWMKSGWMPYIQWEKNNSDVKRACEKRDGDFWSALVIYSAVILEAALLRIPSFIANRLGIKEALNDIGEEAFYQAEIEDITPQDEEHYERLQAMLVNAYKFLLTMPAYESLAELRNIIRADEAFFREGLECYPDMDLPPPRPGASNLDTDPDFYFYNEAIEGDLGFLLKRGEYLDKAKRVLKNTLKNYKGDPDAKPNDVRRFGVISKQWYNSQVISPNKPELNNGESGENTSKDEIRKRAAAFMDESLTASQFAYALEGDSAKKVKKITEGGKSYNKYSEARPAVKEGQSVPFGATSKDDAGEPISNIEELLETGLEASVASFNDETYRMVRAFPTFKIYFLEDDSTTDTQGSKLKNFDDFYSYSAVKDIRITRSRKIPADLCVITLTNVHGQLDTLAFTSNTSDSTKSSHIVEHFNPHTVNTKLENPFSKLVLMEGSKIQVRLGYSNNAEKLETVFNGQVVEIGHAPESADLIQIVCQSYAVELEAEEKHEGEYDDTQELLSCMICSPELTHFGKWKRSSHYAPNEIRSPFTGSNSLGFIDTRIQNARDWALRRWTFLNKPQDDNVFAPPHRNYQGWYAFFLNAMDCMGLETLTELIFGEEASHYKLTPTTRATVWDIFKEMELRHPGYVASPIPYEQRYTMFFGPPDHRYWARPMSSTEGETWEKLEREAREWIESPRIRSDITRRAVARFRKSREIAPTPRPGPGAGTGMLFSGSGSLAGTEQEIQEQMLKNYKDSHEWAITKKYDRFKPFRNYFLVTADNHIIANNITASSYGTHNAVDLGYAYEAEHIEFKGGIVKKSGWERLKMKADDNISDRNTRVLPAKFPNCNNDYFARRYAVGLLMRSLRDVYKGTLVITGNPKIKPYDMVLLYDTYRDMFGPVEVEQVTHIFSQDTGFITEIKPDLVLTHNNLTTQCTMDALWSGVTDYFGEATAIAGGAGAAAGIAVGGGLLGLAAGGVGLGLAVYGGYKLVQWTQERQPLVITPLTIGYKPFMAGLDGYKHDTVYTNLEGAWYNFKKDLKDGWEEFWKKDILSEWLAEHASDLAHGV